MKKKKSESQAPYTSEIRPLSVVKAGDGNLRPALSTLPMRPVVAITVPPRRRKRRDDARAQLMPWMFLVADGQASPSEVHLASLRNCAAMLSLAMGQRGLPSAGVIPAGADNILLQFHAMTLIAQKELDEFEGEITSRRERVRTRVDLTDLQGWTLHEVVEHRQRPGHLIVPAWIASRAARLARRATLLSASGREYIQAKKARSRLDPTDETILTLLLRKNRRMLTAQIARELVRGEKSLSRNLAQLVKLGLVQNEKRKGYVLTEAGREVAMDLTRKATPKL